MKKALLILLPFIFCSIVAFADAPANDDCSGAVDITTSTATLFTTFGATASAQPAYFNGSNDDDVWFKFVALDSHPNYKIELSGVAGHAGGAPPGMITEIWDGCGGAAVDVVNGQGDVLMARGLTTGHTYYIRVYTNGTALNADFNIKATPLVAAANDDCSTAAEITPVTTCTTGAGPFGTEGATQSSQPSGDGTGRDDDVWFKFTTGPTDVYAKVQIINPVYSGTGGQAVIELWNNCADASNAKFLPFSTKATLGTLLPNTTYYIRVYTYGTSSWLTSFNICVSLGAPPPDNDSYFGAAALTINPGTTCQTAVTGATTKGATAEAGGTTCNGGTANDVWYKFTASSLNASIAIVNKVLLPGGASANTKLWMQAYKGSNTAPSLICSGNNVINFDGSSDALTLQAGQTYYIRIYADDPGNDFTFDICTQAPPPPIYDECGRAVNILPDTSGQCQNSVQLSNVNATPSSNNGECLSNVGSDIWLKFTAPAFDNLVISIPAYQVISGSATPLFGIAVYSGACGSFTLVKCGLGKTLVLPALTHGQTYFIRLMVYNPADRGKITVCLHGQPPAATNIDCAHALALNVGAEANTAFVPGNTKAVATDNTLTDCNGNSFVFSKALWFKFTAAATTELVDIENIIPFNGNQTYLGYKVYYGDGTASCAGISSIACTGDVSHQNNVLTSLIVGKVYFVQVLLNGYNGDDASFNIRVINTAAPHNDEAAHAELILQNPVYSADWATQGTFRFSTLSTAPDAAANAGYAGDVWYKFVAAATTATIRTDFGGSSTFIQVYSGAPTAPAMYVSAGPNTVNNITGLTVGQTYYIRLYNPQAANGTTAGSVFGINVFGTPSTDAASVLPAGGACVGIDGGTVQSTNSHKWLHLTKDGKMVASIFDDVNMGAITAAYYINTAGLRQSPGHVVYLDRNFSISPTIHPATPVKIILYFTKEEFDNLATSGDSHVNYLNDLTVAAFNGATCSSALSVSGESDYAIMGYGSLSDDVYFIEVNMPHFSGFFLKSGFGVTLPVTCNSFTATVKDERVHLNWQTGTEINTDKFDVQRSNNALDFATIGSVPAAGQSNTLRYYNYSDAIFKAAGTYYYRLKELDKDGNSSFTCGVQKVTVGAGTEVFSAAYPNPAVSTVTVNIQKAVSGKVGVQIINALGQVVIQKNIEASNTPQINIPVAQLPAGLYSIRLVTKDAVYVKQFSKMK